MTSQFKTVGLLGRAKTAHDKETFKALIHYLQKLNQPFHIDDEIATALDDSSLPKLPASEMSKRCNLIIVVGGDGSILQAAHRVVNDGIPILGVNRGRLGFLNDISPNQLSKIEDILNGQFILERRFLLTATVELNGEIFGQADGLNEVALIPDAAPHMNNFEIYIDSKFVCSQSSDGLIVATPTGSTAYALSGGGPILHPMLNAIVIVPMFPHSLSMRPIVIEGDQLITIVISPQNKTTPRITADSQNYINAPPGSHIHILKKSQPLNLVHPVDYDYYESLRSKLHWGHKLNYSE